jgi:hypothetical protein
VFERIFGRRKANPASASPERNGAWRTETAPQSSAVGRGRAWTQPRTRGRKPTSCEDCRPATDGQTVRPKRIASEKPPALPVVEVLTCSMCGETFERIRTRGRKSPRDALPAPRRTRSARRVT